MTGVTIGAIVAATSVGTRRLDDATRNLNAIRGADLATLEAAR